MENKEFTYQGKTLNGILMLNQALVHHLIPDLSG